MNDTINTIGKLRTAIRAARIVLVQPRFGVSDAWVRVSKAEALGMLDSADRNQTPRDFEFGTAQFAEFRDDTLFIG